MDLIEARQEYNRALKMGQKASKEGPNPHPAVLDDILGETNAATTVYLGLIDIPAQRIVGTKTGARTTAFAANFLPLMNSETEFASKWVELCAAHLSEQGIRDPITCYEYLGDFYVLEGNKRVSVLRYFDAPIIQGNVTRIMPRKSEEPQVRAYFEFLDFYEKTKLYDIRFRQPGDYAKLLGFLGKDPGQPWNERERKTFRSYFHYFREAFTAVKADTLDLLPGEGLLLWLQVYPFRDLGRLSAPELKKTVAGLWEDLVSISQDEPVQVRTEPSEEAKGGILSKILPVGPDHLNVAFIYPLDPATSGWALGHAEGARHMEKVMGERVTVRSYFHGDTPEQAEQLLEQAVEEGAQVVFATTPQMGRATLKAAVKYPKVRFLNCSLAVPYASVRTYYSRVYEGKFITGAIAGAMSDNNHIGYVGSYPILGVPASINAFALGAQLTNPRAKIDLRWSCMEGQPVADFINSGIKVISNRDVPTPSQMYLGYCDYGTYMVTEGGTLQPLGSPCWMWGKFYEHVIRSILKGSWEEAKQNPQALNYWWGMDSGVIDVTLAESLPEGVWYMARMLRQGLRKGAIDPFRRKIWDQNGVIRNHGDRGFTPEEMLHMDWLCDNVEGFIPTYDQVQPFARAMVRELGIYRDQIPAEKEGSL